MKIRENILKLSDWVPPNEKVHYERIADQGAGTMGKRR